MLIKVTKEHINKGKQKDCTKCPVALAIQDVVREGYAVHVNGIMATIYDATRFHASYPLAYPTTMWIMSFDQRSWAMKPFEFLLPIEEQYLRKENNVL